MLQFVGIQRQPELVKSEALMRKAATRTCPTGALAIATLPAFQVDSVNT